MKDEGTQDERGQIDDETTLVSSTIEDDKNQANNKEAITQHNDISTGQTFSSPTEGQNAVSVTSSPTHQPKFPRIVLYVAILLIGIVLGVLGMLIFQLSIGGIRSFAPVTLTPVESGNVTVHADQSIITPLLQSSVQSIDLPANGSISNVQIQFTNGTQMNISGNYQISVLGVPVSQPFTLSAQLIVDNCQVQIHVLQANFSNISVTGLVALFEDKINQKLAQLIPQNNLPGNIEFCLINISTDAQGVNATFNLVVPSSITPTANRARSITIL